MPKWSDRWTTKVHRLQVSRNPIKKVLTRVELAKYASQMAWPGPSLLLPLSPSVWVQFTRFKEFAIWQGLVIRYTALDGIDTFWEFDCPVRESVIVFVWTHQQSSLATTREEDNWEITLNDGIPIAILCCFKWPSWLEINRRLNSKAVNNLRSSSKSTIPIPGRTLHSHYHSNDAANSVWDARSHSLRWAMFNLSTCLMEHHSIRCETPRHCHTTTWCHWVDKRWEQQRRMKYPWVR